MEHQVYGRRGDGRDGRGLEIALDQADTSGAERLHRVALVRLVRGLDETDEGLRAELRQQATGQPATDETGRTGNEHAGPGRGRRAIGHQRRLKMNTRG